MKKIKIKLLNKELMNEKIMKASSMQVKIKWHLLYAQFILKMKSKLCTINLLQV